MNQVSKIINALRKNKVDIDFPNFFEDDKIILKINIRKNDNIEEMLNRIQGIDKKSIKRLLEFL